MSSQEKIKHIPKKMKAESMCQSPLTIKNDSPDDYHSLNRVMNKDNHPDIKKDDCVKLSNSRV